MKRYIPYSGKQIGLLLLAMTWLVMPASAMETVQLNMNGQVQAQSLDLAVGETKVVHSPQRLKRIAIGDPSIATVKLLTSQDVLVKGVKTGQTSLSFHNAGNKLVALMNIAVGYDTGAIKQKLHEVLPNEKDIQVRNSNHAVILSGEVSNALAMDTALTIARTFAGDVKNLMQVGGGQQVMLEVRMAEINRSSVKQLGGSLSGALGTTTFSFLNPVAGLAGVANTGNVSLLYRGTTFRLDALEKQGLAKTLAEPNLVALSGQEASFLVGGEFPYSTSAGFGVANTQFKEFGIGMKFTPMVLTSEKINLKINAEVSAIDTSISGTNNPALKTRRAATTVEVADGQSFAIAGLLQNDINNVINRFPVLGSIPVLGALFRSTDFQRNETELVIIVTPRLVRPVPAGKLLSPTDTFVPTNDVDQYLMGELEAPQSAKPAAPAAPAPQQPAQPAGVDGTFGHQL